MGDKAIQGMDVGHKDNNPMNNDPSNLKNEEPSDNRREPRLRDEQKKITKTRQAKGEVGDVKGTQPAKYYSKDAEGDAMTKDTKVARAKYFSKGGSRKDAPGDIDPKTGERQKTKPSQYTKKFKQMYGEQEKEPAKSDAQKDREEFKKLQKDKKVAQLQYRMAKDAELVARLSQQEDSVSENSKIALKLSEVIINNIFPKIDSFISTEATVHNSTYNWNGGIPPTSYEEFISTATSEFHEYELEWTESELKFYINNNWSRLLWKRSTILNI